MMEIRGNSFLVAGGGSGLGAACVRMLAVQGAKVTIADINDEAGRALADEVAGAQFVHADVTEEARVQEAVARAAEVGTLRGAINCAGIAIAAKVLGRDGVHGLASFRRVIDVNLIGTFNVLRLAAEALQETEPAESGERGVIINTASVAAFEGQIGQVA
jgi:NAD(P)-dependent dehydrogenase (short-subunit alcohol dehydrogenase family)